MVAQRFGSRSAEAIALALLPSTNGKENAVAPDL
jgi:hypothetical protein